MKLKTLYKIFDKAYEKRKSICLLGDYGIGKSAIVYQYAQKKAEELRKELVIWHELTEEQKKEIAKNIEKYFVVVDIKLQSVGDISKLTGIPIIINGDGNHKVFWQPPEFIKIFSNPKATGIFFLDEINMALPSLQSTTFEILLQRKIGEWKLSDNVLIISAGNTLDVNISANPIPKPQINRVIFLTDFQLSLEDWLNWAINKKIDERIIAFVKLFEELKKDSEEELEQSTRPRSYEILSDMIKNENEDDFEYIKQVAYATLHKITASKFIKFLEHIRELDYKEYLENPERFRNLDLEKKYALITIIAQKYKDFKEKEKKQLTELFKVISDDVLELSAVLLSMIKMNIKDTKEIIKLVSKLDLDVKNKLFKIVVE